MKVRLARPGDEPGIHNAHMRSINEICIHDHGPEEVKGWGSRPFGNRWKTQVANEKVWVIDDNGEIKGVGYINLKEGAYIEALYFTPEATGRGFAKEMLKKMIDQAIEKGAKEILLDSTHTARGFYERNGFKLTGPSYQRPIGGIPVTCYPMKMEL